MEKGKEVEKARASGLVSSQVLKIVHGSQKDPVLIERAGISTVLFNKALCYPGTGGSGNATKVKEVTVSLEPNKVLVRNKQNELMEVVILLPKVEDYKPRPTEQAAINRFSPSQDH